MHLRRKCPRLFCSLFYSARNGYMLPKFYFYLVFKKYLQNLEMLITHQFFFQTMRLVTDSEITKRHIKNPANHLRGNFSKTRLWHLAYNIYVVWRVIGVRSKRFKPLAISSLIYIGINTKSCRRVSRTPAIIYDAELFNNS